MLCSDFYHALQALAWYTVDAIHNINANACEYKPYTTYRRDKYGLSEYRGQSDQGRRKWEWKRCVLVLVRVCVDFFHVSWRIMSEFSVAACRLCAFAHSVQVHALALQLPAPSLSINGLNLNMYLRVCSCVQADECAACGFLACWTLLRRLPYACCYASIHSVRCTFCMCVHTNSCAGTPNLDSRSKGQHNVLLNILRVKHNVRLYYCPQFNWLYYCFIFWYALSWSSHLKNMII